MSNPFNYSPKPRLRRPTPRNLLTADARDEIRRWWRTGEVSMAALAKEYRVRRHRIWQIVSSEQETA